MLFELKKIFSEALRCEAKGVQTVLATVVALEGSSYRRPGVRMLIDAEGNQTGAVSGGCVEKEIVRQASQVIENGEAIIMNYDGRFRLGCEGMLYILLEPFKPNAKLYNWFQEALEQRVSIAIGSRYDKQVGACDAGVSYLMAENGEPIFFRDIKLSTKPTEHLFKQVLKPQFKLIIVGAEHDAVELTKIAAGLGWQVEVVCALDEQKRKTDFPGCSAFHHCTAEEWGRFVLDSETAVVLMSHSFVRDLAFLKPLVHKSVQYIGLLGPHKRKNKLLNELIEQQIILSDSFAEALYAPAGLNIGAETAQEIAVSIIAEISTVFRQKEPGHLKDRIGAIHS